MRFPGFFGVWTYTLRELRGAALSSAVALKCFVSKWRRESCTATNRRVDGWARLLRPTNLSDRLWLRTFDVTHSTSDGHYLRWIVIVFFWTSVSISESAIVSGERFEIADSDILIKVHSMGIFVGISDHSKKITANRKARAVARWRRSAEFQLELNYYEMKYGKK